MVNFKQNFLGGYKKEEVDVYLKELEETNKKLKEEIQVEQERFQSKEEQVKKEQENWKTLLAQKEEEKEKIEKELLQMRHQFTRLVEENEKLSSKIRSVELSNDFLRRQLVRHEIELPQPEQDKKEAEKKEGLDEEIEKFNQMLMEGASLKEEEGTVNFSEKKQVKSSLESDRKNNRYVKMLKKMIDF